MESTLTPAERAEIMRRTEVAARLRHLREHLTSTFNATSDPSCHYRIGWLTQAVAFALSETRAVEALLAGEDVAS